MEKTQIRGVPLEIHVNALGLLAIDTLDMLVSKGKINIRPDLLEIQLDGYGSQTFGLPLPLGYLFSIFFWLAC